MIEHPIRIEGEARGFSQRDGDTVLRAALRAGVGFPYECNSGGCGSCKFELLDGEIEDLWPQAPGLSDRDRRKKRLLACQCRAKGPLQISVRTADEYRPAIAPLRRRAEFLGAVAVTHDLHEFRFRAEERADFLAGQYALLAISGVASARAYSMSNLANERGEWQFHIRLVAAGQATDRLFNHLQKGECVEIDGPYGLAYLRRASSRDIVCVAGGSGLAPMLSIARGASQAGMLQDRQLHFFYGARTQRDLCGEAFLRELPEYGARIHYHPVVSQASAAGQPAWAGATGLVHHQVQRVLGPEMSRYEYYFAGPPPMTQALQEMLMLEHQVQFDLLHFDRFF